MERGSLCKQKNYTPSVFNGKGATQFALLYWPLRQFPGLGSPQDRKPSVSGGSEYPHTCKKLNRGQVLIFKSSFLPGVKRLMLRFRLPWRQVMHTTYLSCQFYFSVQHVPSGNHLEGKELANSPSAYELLLSHCLKLRFCNGNSRRLKLEMSWVWPKIPILKIRSTWCAGDHARQSVALYQQGIPLQHSIWILFGSSLLLYNSYS